MQNYKENTKNCYPVYQKYMQRERTREHEVSTKQVGQLVDKQKSVSGRERERESA